MAEGNPIKKDDLGEKNVGDNILNALKAIRDSLEKSDAQLVEFAKNLKKAMNFNMDSRGLAEFQAMIERINKAYERKLALEQSQATTAAQIDRAERDRVRQLRERQSAEHSLQRQRERGIALLERERRRAEELARPYNQLTAQLTASVRAGQDLGAQLIILQREGRENTQQFRDLSAAYEQNVRETRELNDGVVRLDRSLGRHHREVGNYENALRNLQTTGRGVTNFLGQFGIALGAAAIGQKVIQTLRDFDEGAANIAKTVGVTTERARELSRELAKIDTRTSIKDLQEIAAIGGQLGVGEKDILGFTSAVDKLNVALGDEFTGGAEEITSVVGGLRNVFSDVKSDKIDEDILKIGNAINELGASGAATGPVVSDFAGRIGGVGIPLGLTTGQVLGLSATLQELNVNAERGGTAVSKILQAMGKNTQEFAKLAGVPLKEFEHLVNTDIYGAFQKVVAGTKQFEGNTVGLSKTLDKLGIDGAGASEVFLKLGGNMELLDKRTTLANESLGNTASITDEFNTKNETLGANLDKATKSFDAFIISEDAASGATGVISSLVGTLARNMPAVIGAVIQFTAAFVAYKVAVGLANTQFTGPDGILRNLFTLRTNTQSATDSLVNGERAATGFGKALKGIAFASVIAGAIELAKLLYDIASGAKLAEIRLKALDDAQKKGQEVADQVISKSKKTRDENIKRLEEFKASGKITAAVYDETLKKIKSNYIEQRKIEIDNAVSRRDNIKKQIEDLKTQREGINDVFDPVRAGELDGLIIAKEGELRAVRVIINAENAAIAEQTEIIADENNKQAASVREATEKEKKAREDRLKALEDYTRRAEDIEDKQGRNDLTVQKLQLQRKLDRDLEGIKYSGKAADRLRTDLINEFNAEILRLEKEADEKLIEQDRAYWEQIKQNQLQAKAEYEATLEANLSQELEELSQNDKRRELLLLKSNVIEKEYDKKALENKRASLEEQLEILKYYGKNTIDVELEIAKLDKEIAEKQAETRKNIFQKMFDGINKAIQFGTDLWTRNIDKQIAKQDEQIAKSQELENRLREQANNGNINAKESILAEQRLQEEALRKKEQLEKRKARITAISGILQNFNNKVANGDKNAVATTLLESGELLAFLKTLPSFKDGIEDTGNGGNLDGDGGFIAKLHRNERVIDAENNAKMNGVSNSSVANIVHQFQTGQLVDARKFEGATAYASNFEPVERAIERMENNVIKAIENMPRDEYNMFEVVDGQMKLTKTTIEKHVKTVTSKIYRS